MATILKLVNGYYSPPQESNRKLGRDAGVEFVATILFVFSGTMSAVSTSKTLTGEGTGGNVAQILPISMCFGVTILALAHSIGHLTGGMLKVSVMDLGLSALDGRLNVRSHRLLLYTQLHSQVT